MSSEKVFSSKLGTTRAGPRTRIWLEGNRLLAHGFNHGAMVARIWEHNRLVLRVFTDKAAFDSLPREARGHVAGTAERPIIDISTTLVAETFKGERVRVAYRVGKITITDEEG